MIWYLYIPIWFPCRFWAFETLTVGVYHNSFIVSSNVARFLGIKYLSCSNNHVFLERVYFIYMLYFNLSYYYLLENRARDLLSRMGDHVGIGTLRLTAHNITRMKIIFNLKFMLAIVIFRLNIFFPQTCNLNSTIKYT